MWAKRHPLRALAYIAWDPEVDTFTYDLANGKGLELALARVLDIAVPDVRRAMSELAAEPELNERLAADVRWRPRFKRRPSLPAHHRSAWVITRLLRPECVVETGILDGLGSRVILAALQRNAHEGDDGELISFDVMPGVGALVPHRLRARWQPVYEADRDGSAPVSAAVASDCWPTTPTRVLDISSWSSALPSTMAPTVSFS